MAKKTSLYAIADKLVTKESVTISVTQLKAYVALRDATDQVNDTNDSDNTNVNEMVNQELAPANQ